MGKFDVIQWTNKSTTSLRDKEPITACFGLYPKVYTANKLVYKAVVVGDEYETPEYGVLKARRFRPGTERYWQGELDLNRYASQLGASFTDRTLAGRIELADQYLAPVHKHKSWDKVCLKMKPRYFRQLTKFEMVLVEELVRDIKVFNNDKVLDAFSHFSYSESNEDRLLYAFKGNRTREGRYLLLTPEMLTHKYDIHKWFQKHVCNEICSRFRKPPEITNPEKPSNTDIQPDKSFYDFRNDLRPPNYYDEMPREEPNAPEPNYKNNNLDSNYGGKTCESSNPNVETTFGVKSCDGSFSVVTAVVHSDSIGKSKPTKDGKEVRFNKERSEKDRSETERKFVQQDEDTYNVIPNADDSTDGKEREIRAKKNLPSEVENVPVKLKDDLYPKVTETNNKPVESSTLVIRPSAYDRDIVNENFQNKSRDNDTNSEGRVFNGEDYLDGEKMGILPRMDGYQTMIIHHTELEDEKNTKPIPRYVNVIENKTTEDCDTTEISDIHAENQENGHVASQEEINEALQEKSDDDLPDLETIQAAILELQTNDKQSPSNDETSESSEKDTNELGVVRNEIVGDVLKDEPKTEQVVLPVEPEEKPKEETDIKDKETSIYMNVEELRINVEPPETLNLTNKYEHSTAEVIQGPMLRSPTQINGPVNELTSANGQKEEQTAKSPNDQILNECDNIDSWVSLEMFQNHYLLKEKEKKNPSTEQTVSENEGTVSNENEPKVDDESKHKPNDDPSAENIVDNEEENNVSTEYNGLNISDIKDDEQDEDLGDYTELELNENDQKENSDVSKVSHVNGDVSRDEKRDSQDLITKYNLQNFIDSENNFTDKSSSLSITDFLPISSAENKMVDGLQQKPLQSSLRSDEEMTA